MPFMEPALQTFIERIQRAAADSAPLSIQAGGTKDFLHGGPAAGEPLDVRSYAGIVDYEPSELVVTARAGTPLAELEAALAERGQYLPFEPPHFMHSNAAAVAAAAAPRPHPLAVQGEMPSSQTTLSAADVASSSSSSSSTPTSFVASGTATVGGMVAAGLSGPARASVGAARDFVLGAHFINGRGALMQFGGQVMKNVAGYDVSRLLVGSMGVLGLITQVSLKVLPLAPAEATLRFACTQADALAMLHGWGGEPLPLNASCWLQEDAGASTGTLYVRLRGASAAVRTACARMGGQRIDASEAERQRVAADWHACRDQRLPWFAERPESHGLWRLSVPQTAPVLALEAELFGTPLVEWHGGLRWYRAPMDDAHAARRLRDAASAVGGSAMLFIAGSACPASAGGIFDAQKADSMQASIARIHRGLKAEFDPAGIFNRGRLLAGM